LCLCGFSPFYDTPKTIIRLLATTCLQSYIESMRILLIINRNSGAGCGSPTLKRLQAIMAESVWKQASCSVEIVDNHSEALYCSRSFFRESDEPAAIITGGGSGTLRAAIEGICSDADPLPGPDRVRIASLRMGSGNLLARHFGVQKDPELALKAILKNLQQDRTEACSVMRCEIGTPAGSREVHYAAVMTGLGQFGRVPGDLARLHGRFPGLRSLLARLLGIERLNRIEYTLALLIRSLFCSLFPGYADVVDIRTDHLQKTMRLLAGAVINFPFRELPINPDIRIDDEALSVSLILLERPVPLLLKALSPAGLIRQFKIEKPDRLEIRFAGSRPVEFFLDEDPVVAYGGLSIQVAGTMAFIPGIETTKTQRTQRI
jgi:hypothetical protein